MWTKGRTIQQGLFHHCFDVIPAMDSAMWTLVLSYVAAMEGFFPGAHLAHNFWMENLIFQPPMFNWEVRGQAHLSFSLTKVSLPRKS